MKFADAFRLSVAWLSFTALFAVLCVTLGMLVLVHGLQVRGIALLTSFGVFAVIIAIVAIRGFFAGFGEFYSFSGRQMFGVWLGATLVAVLITPLTFLPALLTILYLEPWINLIW